MKTTKIIASILAIAGILATSTSAQTSKNATNDPKEREKIVALTFDDGPSSTTPKVLEVIKEQNVVASFFLCGQYIDKNTRDIIKTMVAQGCEVGNHSRSHEHMTKLTKDKIRMEVNYTSHAIRQVTGKAPAFFRPPYIDYNDVMMANINMPFIAGFSVEDWLPEVDAKERARRVLAQVKPGDIILLHDFENNDATVEALKIFIPEMKKQGYEFVTISDLFKRAGITPKANDRKLYNNVYE